jgi:hypothetical protein
MKIKGTSSGQRRIQQEIKNFSGGVNRLLEEARIGFNEAKEATNLIQVQDGLWKPRWGSAYYGAELPATCDGAKEFVKTDGTTELVAVAGGKAYKSSDGGSWTEITGATFTSGIQCFFMQISGYLYITNGTDNLARYNGSVLSTYNSILAPTGLAGARTGLSDGTVSEYAEVTAVNEIGETVGSTEAILTINKPRDQWTTGEKITWTWNTVSGASSYQIYISEVSGNETLLASATNPSYIDDGTVAINPYVEPPLSNTTAAPKFKAMEVSGNRIWGTNDPDSPFTVYFSGTGQDMGKFSDFYGGGWVNLERGGRETPKAVKHYQSGTGDGRATILCSTPEGKGAVWQISIASATVGDYSFSVPTAIKVVGSSGTDSQLSVVADNNNIWFFNRRGFFTLGPEKNYYGLLRTNELSSRIRPYVRGLVGSKIDTVCGYFYDAKIFFSVPTSSTGNNRIIYYDTERMNWVVDWSVGAKQFLEYTDSSKNTHFLYVPVGGDRLVELSEDIQGDFGVAFNTTYISGRWPLSKLWKDFIKLKKVYIKLGNPRGSINFEVAGSTKSGGFTSIGSSTITPQYSMTGMGYDLMGGIQMGDSSGFPTTFSDSSDPRYIKINKKLRDIQIRLTTNSLDADYTLQSFIFDGLQLNTNPPSSWKI